MTRIQILELPTEHRGDDMITPFALVIDQVPTDEAKFDAIRRDLLNDGDLASRLGARAVLVFEDTIEIPANEVPVDPSGYPLKIRVEGDFDTFREQVQDEIRKAERSMRQAIQYTDKGTYGAALT